MQEPTLQGVQDSSVSDAGGDATEHTSQQKLIAAAGVALIGAYIGYTLTQSYRGEAPQALWAHTAKSATSNAHQPTALPHIAFVNLHDDVRPAAREGLRAWLSLTDEVHATFPTVMFVEEAETSSFAEISGDVRRATLFAHAELLSSPTAHRTAAAKAPSAVSAPQCTVVYRCVTEVEGQPLEDWDVEAPALRRWHGKPFQQRHCLGFTVDGRTATVLLQDVSGVLHTVRSQAPTSPIKTALHDGAALLKECGVPSSTTFQNWWPPSPSRSAPSPSSLLSMETTAAAAPTAEKVDALKLFARNGRHASLWRGPFALFSLLGAVLRYNRDDAAIYPRLLTRRPAAPFAAGSAWWGYARSLVPFSRGGGGGTKGEGGVKERRSRLSAPFLILVRAVEGSPAPPAEVLREVQACTAQWVRHLAVLAPKHEAALTEVYREAGGQWGLRVDLTRVQTSVLEAEWLLTHVVRLLASVGVPLASARLVAVPEVPSAASLLYPTPETATLAHYWQPQKSTAPAAPLVTVNSKPPTTPSSSSAVSAHPSWMQVELRAGKKMGFVVAHHAFNAL